MRKENDQGTEQINNPQAGANRCNICNSRERSEIERKVLEGWRYCDIINAHPFILRSNKIVKHFEHIGLANQIGRAQEIKTKSILADVIRAGKPGLEQGKVYPRDVIEACKALEALEGKEKTDSIWEEIEGFRIRKRSANADRNTNAPKVEEQTNPGTSRLPPGA